VYVLPPQALPLTAHARPLVDAPSLQHINGTQWTPDLVTYDAARLVRSTSYYVQQLFATHLGTHVLATTPAAGSAPVWWVASINQTSGTYYLKVANTGATAVSASIELGFAAASPARVTALAGPALASNTLDAPNTVVPVSGTVPVAGGNRIAYTFPAYGVVVFVMEKAGGATSTVSSSAPKPSCTAVHWEQCGGIGVLAYRLLVSALGLSVFRLHRLHHLCDRLHVQAVPRLKRLLRPVLVKSDMCMPPSKLYTTNVVLDYLLRFNP
jgi:hypothetical protein